MSQELTVTVRDELANAIGEAVARGEFQTPSHAVEAALVEWQHKKDKEKLSALRAAIDEGDRDIAAGSTGPYDRQDIIAGGRKLRAARSS